MKNTTKKILGFVGLGLGAILLSSCTANFCSNVDKANMAYPYEQGVTVYCEKDDVPTDYKRVDKYSKTLGVKEACLAIDGNTTVYKYVPCEVTTNSGTTSSSSATSGATSVTTSAAATSASSASSSAVTTTTYKYTANKATYLQNTVISSATTNGYRIPSIQYLSAIDDYVLRAAIVEAQLPGNYTSDASYDVSDDKSAFSIFVKSITVSTVSDTVWCVNPYTLPDPTSAEAQISANQIRLQTTGGNSILRRYGEMKFSGLTLKDGKVSDHPLWGYWTAWNQELKFSTDPGLGVDGCPSNDFVTLYKNDVTSKVNSITSCISTQTDYFGHYGNFADWEVSIERKDWSYAWNKGFLEGLLVYPISWMVDTFAYGMDPTLSGVGQIWAIVFVTLIVRGIMLLATFKTTLDQQKMQALQPQLAKLQAKYPNSNTNTAEKQRLAQEQMALYKRNKIHPFGQFIVLIFQFPIFICVWSALQGSAALSSGEFLNMRLSDTIKDILFNVTGTWYYNTTGWWTALILFILMAATQFFAMFLPQLITKIRTKKEVTRLSKNPAQDSTQKQMKWITYGMLAFTIIMGFFLPAAMGIYWLIGGLISMAQTGITQIVMAKSAKKKGV
ncbi:MAG: Membrane protein insertase YidC [Tenericutes bacterium ADurb.BinA155]|nr:MAG: Membrane protein insertase YidC [Tenericutes bacterium ADurb.BinA155]